MRRFINEWTWWNSVEDQHFRESVFTLLLSILHGYIYIFCSFFIYKYFILHVCPPIVISRALFVSALSLVSTIYFGVLILASSIRRSLSNFVETSTDHIKRLNTRLKFPEDTFYDGYSSATSRFKATMSEAIFRFCFAI